MESILIQIIYFVAIILMGLGFSDESKKQKLYKIGVTLMLIVIASKLIMT